MTSDAAELPYTFGAFEEPVIVFEGHAEVLDSDGVALAGECQVALESRPTIERCQPRRTRRTRYEARSLPLLVLVVLPFTLYWWSREWGTLWRPDGLFGRMKAKREPSLAE